MLAQSTARPAVGAGSELGVVFLLPPHHRNLGKRVVKMPAVFSRCGPGGRADGHTDDGAAVHPPARRAVRNAIVGGISQGTLYNAGFPSTSSGATTSAAGSTCCASEPDGLHPIEIKSASTSPTAYQKGLRSGWRSPAMRGRCARCTPGRTATCATASTYDAGRMPSEYERIALRCAG